MNQTLPGEILKKKKKEKKEKLPPHSTHHISVMMTPTHLWMATFERKQRKNALKMNKNGEINEGTLHMK